MSCKLTQGITTARRMASVALHFSRLAPAKLSMLFNTTMWFADTYVSQLTDTGRFRLPEVPLWLRSTASSPLEPSSLHECASGECCDSLEVPLGLATCGWGAEAWAVGVALMALWLERAGVLRRSRDRDLESAAGLWRISNAPQLPYRTSGRPLPHPLSGGFDPLCLRGLFKTT
jgi:hypothetical protein